MQPNVFENNARNCEHARLFAKLDLLVEVPNYAESVNVDRPLVPRTLLVDEPLWPEHRDWSRRRNSSILECVSILTARFVKHAALAYFPEQSRCPLSHL